jgi:hypothetical protein
LYEDTAVAHWHDWINCFIELCGNHRFGTDPWYGEVCERFRNGEPTDNDFDYVNERVFNVELPDGNWSNPGGPTIINVPSNTAYVTPTNQDRCAINDNIFAKHLEESQSKDVNVSPPKHTIIVRSDKVSYRVKREYTPLAMSAKSKLWTHCPDYKVVEDMGEDSKKYRDTCLKLHSNAPVMLTNNTDVENQQANGTVGHLQTVKLKPEFGEDDIDIVNVDGYYVRAVYASKVACLVCKHENSNRTFEVEATDTNCVAEYPMELLPGQVTWQHIDLKVNVFPVLVNHATTGHKLQGKTKENLIVSSWQYSVNWPYVALSRVRTHKGLFLWEPLNHMKDYKYDDCLWRMMDKMRKKAPLDPNDEYYFR